MLSIVSPDIIFLALPALILLVGIFVSLTAERLAHPHCPGLLRPWSSVLIHAGLLTAAWAATMIFVRRPAFSLLLVLAGQLVVIQINNAKYRALREPFLFSDFGIFSQTIKHPRLYLPFLGLWRAVLMALAVLTAVGFGWWVEKPLPDFLIWSGGAALVAALLFGFGWINAAPPSLDPEEDLSRHGLFTSIAQYWLREKTTEPQRLTRLPVLRKQDPDSPDIVVIQSESFFDARRLFSGVRQDVLQNYDEACRAAGLYGRLEVPAWGANTMRPEFSFLTGMAPASLGIHRFNPYRRVTRQPLRALPTVLREAGYQTTCIHPHPARFFRRDRAFPNLGFDRFVDDRAFGSAVKEGPYISDKAATEKLIGELEAADRPSLFFVITMENHGPLHLERVAPGDMQDFYSEPPPPGCDDLTVYLRHLRNADRELGRLRAFLAARSRPCLLCFYGEHLPSMPSVYDILGFPDGRTDYFLETPWRDERGHADLKVAQLPREILRLLIN
jgi:hypothetical protein